MASVHPDCRREPLLYLFSQPWTVFAAHSYRTTPIAARRPAALKPPQLATIATPSRQLTAEIYTPLASPERPFSRHIPARCVPAALFPHQPFAFHDLGPLLQMSEFNWGQPNLDPRRDFRPGVLQFEDAPEAAGGRIDDRFDEIEGGVEPARNRRSGIERVGSTNLHRVVELGGQELFGPQRIDRDQLKNPDGTRDRRADIRDDARHHAIERRPNGVPAQPGFLQGKVLLVDAARLTRRSQRRPGLIASNARFVQLLHARGMRLTALLQTSCEQMPMARLTLNSTV